MYRKKSKIDDRDKTLLPVIKQIMSENPSYGRRRRIMKKYGLKPAKRRPKRPRKLNDLNKLAVSYKNLVKNICPIKPHVIWVSDFTYIPFKDSFVYLAAVTDVFTRMIVGWHIIQAYIRFCPRGCRRCSKKDK